MTAVNRNAAFGHPLQDDAGVERRAFDGREQLVLCGVEQVPAERDAAEIRLDQHGPVAVVPCQAQEAGLAGAILIEAHRELLHIGIGAARDRLEDIAGRRQPGLDADESRIDAARHDAAHALNAPDVCSPSQ